MNKVTVKTIAFGNGNQTKRIFVETLPTGQDVLYACCGNAAMICEVNSASDSEIRAAYGPDENWQDDLFHDLLAMWKKDCTPAARPRRIQRCESVHAVENDFEKALKFCEVIPAEDFILEIDYAKACHNSFSPKFKELAHVVNADDCYCTVIIDATRHISDELTNKAIGYLTNNNIPVSDRAAVWRFLNK